MFEEYKKDLLKFYLINRKSGRLSINLDSPGREKLRKECIYVFKIKSTPKDKDLIKSVFDPTDQYEDQVRSIEKFSLDRFRPLISFLKEEVKIVRDDKLIRLLAWLLDFPTYSEWREFSEEELKLIFEEAAKKPEDDTENEIPELYTSEPTSDFKESVVKPTTPPGTIISVEINDGDKGAGETINIRPSEEPVYERRFSPRYITMSCIILLFACNISFIVWENWSTTVRMPKADEKHMYWDGDHYEPVKEGEQKAGVSIIPLDLKTLQQQRKITLPDTLTKHSLGKVWYKGYGSNHEYFTFKGVYPADTARTLRPLSNTILTKYTSNYRYTLTRLVWFLYAAIFVSLCGYGVSRMKRKVSIEKPEQKTDDHIINFSEVQLAQQ